MKKRICCLLLAVVMCILYLSGCSNNKSDKTDYTENSGNGENTDNTVNDGNTDNSESTEDSGSNDSNHDTDENWWDSISYDTTNIIFMMTKCTNSNELSSGCERYLAGEGEYDQSIDKLVEQRNDQAYTNTRVTVSYKYYPDINGQDGYGYSRAQQHMISEMGNPTIDTPDIYCNWITDMLICSLRGCFANVYTTNTNKHGENYFDINTNLESDYNEYMPEIMESLSVVRSKIYIIASDYFIDLVRSFYVVPVNVTLFKEASSKVGQYGDALTDLNGDNVIDINDLFEEVKNGNWTYQRLIQYSQAIYTPAESNNSDIDAMTDEKIGFALAKNPTPAAALIYSSSAKIINRVPFNDETYSYTYGDGNTNTSLEGLMSAISNMLDAKGLVTATREDGLNLNLQGSDSTPLGVVRERFRQNGILFGGIITLGSLEDDKYQSMKNGGDGFGIVPVPLYEKGDAYKTQIHFTGRAGAIRYSSTKFSVCSAFLRYQSENSTEILNRYYEDMIVHGESEGLDGNLGMLAFLRAEDNLNSIVDMYFEEAMAHQFNNLTATKESEKYYNLLCHTYLYKFDTFAREYSSLCNYRRNNLYEITTRRYNYLPD